MSFRASVDLQQVGHVLDVIFWVGTCGVFVFWVRLAVEGCERSRFGLVLNIDGAGSRGFQEHGFSALAHGLLATFG